MDAEASYRFTHAVCRKPGRSVVRGLRASDAGDPDFDAFCFSGYRVIECPEGEEAAANLVRVNDVVLASAGHPRTVGLLASEGHDVRTISTAQAARLDGGLSCMSLRFRRPAASAG